MKPELKHCFLILVFMSLCFALPCCNGDDDDDDQGNDPEPEDDDDDTGGDDDDDDTSGDDDDDNDDNDTVDTLVEVDGLPVIRLKGDPYERGYEMGRVMGDKMVILYQEYILKHALGFSPAFCGLYKALKDFACQVTTYTEDEMDQIQGISDAIEEHWDPWVTLVDGSEMMFNINDICVANVIADFAQIACSSASAWGELTEDGQTIIARNLDWEPGPDNILGANTIVISETPEDESWNFVSVTFPGYFGCLSCMNGKGHATFIHDTNRYHSNIEFMLEPRTMLLRRAILAAEGSDEPWAAFESVVEAGKVDTGNNFHTVRPADGTVDGAVVFEVDDNEAHGDGFATQRNGDETEFSNIAATDALLVTNHHRKRYSPHNCWRYDSLSESMDTLSAGGKAYLTMTDLHQMMIHVEFTELTVQTILFKPADYSLTVYHNGPGYLASEHPGVAVPADVLFPW